MKNKLYFIGGAKGVGKTSLLEEVHRKKNLELINTGDFFNKANKLNENNSKDIAKKNMINFLSNGTPMIVDTHYAGFLEGIYSGKFERGLYWNELELINSHNDLELVLIDLDISILKQRRINDNLNERDYSIENIKKELEFNRLYFYEYCAQLSKKGTVIQNIDYNESLKQLSDLIE